MASGLSIARGGAYNRIAPPTWQNPLDTRYSKESGGRWNEKGSHGTLYLNASVGLARAQVQHKLAGQPYGIEDLQEEEQHDLVEVDVPVGEFLDCVSDDGLIAVGLPDSYPSDGAGGKVGWESCQPIGATAHSEGLAGIACRSAAQNAPAGDEELAVFEGHAAGVAITGRRSFAEWYL